MLASVMPDLRAIGGDTSLFDGLQEETLEAAVKNSIFVTHMVCNSLKRQPSLGLFRGFAMVRSGETKNTIDNKNAGVIPVVDLGPIYALVGQLAPTNTRARILTRISAGAFSPSGGRGLLDEYDLIAELRLEHQAAQIERGERPDNFVSAISLSDFDAGTSAMPSLL